MKSRASWILLICLLSLFGGILILMVLSPLTRDHQVPTRREGIDFSLTKAAISVIQEPTDHVLPRAGSTSRLTQSSEAAVAIDPDMQESAPSSMPSFGMQRGEKSISTHGHTHGHAHAHTRPIPRWLNPPVEDADWVSEATNKCTKILKKLWAKQGGIDLPTIEIVGIGAYGKPAEYDVNGQRILLDPKTYQLCLSLPNLGEEALAFLIAHELIHSYQHSSFDYKSLGFFVETTSIKDWAKQDQIRRKKMETQADIWGAILCYMAGYQVEQSIPAFIDELYEAFDLAEEDPGYDSKTERLAIAKRAQKEVRKSIQIFEMANYLSVLQRHDKDTILYRYLTDQFRSAEFYNNLGISYLRLALPKLDEPYRSLPYPFLMDTETRLKQAISKQKFDIGRMIRVGISQFDLIPDLNPDYDPAYLNRAIGYHMLSAVEAGQKQAHLQEAKSSLSKISSPGYTSKVRILQELIHSTRVPKQFVRSFTETGEPAPITAIIDNIDLSDGYALDELAYTWETTVSFSEGIVASGKELPHSNLLCLEDKGRFSHTYIQKIHKRIPNLPASLKGKVYQVGSQIPTVEIAGLRKTLALANGGYFLIDDRYGIVYNMNAMDRVNEWVVWREW
ncbi:MAG: hypothetical protein AAF587_38335 [Bacteroidota bacterium]